MFLLCYARVEQLKKETTKYIYLSESELLIFLLSSEKKSNLQKKLYILLLIYVIE